MSEGPSPELSALNHLSDHAFRDLMRACCPSKNFALGMAKHRPFADEEALFSAARLVWNGLSTEEWMDVYSSHPKIGERKRRCHHHGHSRSEKWSRGEQEGVSGADSELLKELEILNDEYYRKHGFIFLICASGKSAEEMVDNLKERLQNDTSQEIFEAANEQVEITEIRLRKAMAEFGNRISQ